MAAPMRSSSQDAGHRARVADSRTGNATATKPADTTTQPSNFEYDDNEWDIGIGDLIIDLDADIEKTNEGANTHTPAIAMAANAGGPQAAKAAATAKMAIEHSATVDKGLKMKIKRTKPGTKTSEAKHEIVKSNELNGNADQSDLKGTALPVAATAKHVAANNAVQPATASSNSSGGGNSKRGSSGHRRDKIRDKHGSSSSSTSSSNDKNGGQKVANSQQPNAVNVSVAEMNGMVRVSAPQTGPPRSVFPASTGPGPPQSAAASTGPSPGPPPSPAAATAQGSAAKPEQAKVAASNVPLQPSTNLDERSSSPPPAKKLKTESKEDSEVQSTSSSFCESRGESSTTGSTTSTETVPDFQKKILKTLLYLKEQNNQILQLLKKNSSELGSSLLPHDLPEDFPVTLPLADFQKLKILEQYLNNNENVAALEVSDVCIGTSVGTITEPDCLGPCEPGTSVTLEGIVWHETEGGVLVVNVTWRGKTYVGTLLDCTRHDWAPPRFCDSPTSDLDNRTPKGRETRSSVHSKLRNGGVKGRRGAANGSGPSTAPSSPTPFVPPRPEPSNKRKNRAGEEESPSPSVQGKKTKIVVPPPNPPVPSTPTPCGSPPPSPVLLECPEPNCSKKYKHINGLKYHQSHAHGSVDDDDTKDVTSMSENDESNIEAPSPATPVKSPDKSQDSPLTPQKKETELPLILRGAGLLDVPSQPVTPRSTPPSPATPQSDSGTGAGSPTVPLVEPKNVVKPGVLRYTPPEEYPVGVFTPNKQQVTGTPMSNSGPLPATVRNVSVSLPSDQPSSQTETNAQPQSFTNQLQCQVNMPSQQFTQPPTLIIPPQNLQTNQQIPSQMSPHAPQSPSQQQSAKITQFKVKPTAALMPEDKTKQQQPQQPQQQQQQQQQQPQQNGNSINKPQNFKKKNRKSPAGSPHPPQTEQPVFGVEQTARDEVQSPAYSDISDDGAPPMETDIGDKNKNADKKTESGQSLPHMPQYGMYPFYGQPQYLVPSVQQQSQEGKKEPEKTSEKPIDKDGKKEGSDYPQKILPQQHYYPYGYMPGYPYNMDPNFGGVAMVQEEKIKEERIKESPSPIIEQPIKQPAPIPNPIQVPTPGKVKTEPPIKEKHQNENHQILKESIEIKNQMNPYMYSRQQQQQQQQQQSHHNQREEDVRRFYVYDQRRKEQQSMDHHKSSTPNKAPPPPSPSLKHKEPKPEEKKEKDIKQEGVKPTMETQGPPPPPTSQYAYIHPSYMQSAHYGALPFDPNHPMYRGIMVPGPYSGNPYLHAQIPRYHAPEDLSRAPPPPKALDMLQHHAQYYSSHKIHELQERAIKSPTPKTSVASSSPSTISGQSTMPSQPQMTQPPTSQPTNTTPSGGKQTPGDNKDSRSPPPQRHVHTHHHTHVGLGYPMYPPPYGAAVLASQQAAAVTVINPYPTK